MIESTTNARRRWQQQLQLQRQQQQPPQQQQQQPPQTSSAAAMKVDTVKLKKGSSELTSECRELIDELTKRRTRAELLEFLDTVHVWIYGKCELYHWIEILDRFDKILEEAARHVNNNEFVLQSDTTFLESVSLSSLNQSQSNCQCYRSFFFFPCCPTGCHTAIACTKLYNTAY